LRRPRAASAYKVITSGSLMTDADGNGSSSFTQKSARPSASETKALASPGKDASAARAGANGSMRASVVDRAAADDRYAPFR